MKSVRKQKQFLFISVNDGSTCQSLQVVAPTDQFPEYANLVDDNLHTQLRKPLLHKRIKRCALSSAMLVPNSHEYQVFQNTST